MFILVYNCISLKKKVALIVCLSLQKGVAPYIHWCKLIPQFLVALKVWINEIERWHQTTKELPLFQVHAIACTNGMFFSKATLKRKQPEMFKIKTINGWMCLSSFFVQFSTIYFFDKETLEKVFSKTFRSANLSIDVSF